jgi:hypothetical protein
MSSSTTGERPTEGGQRLTHRWPPITGLAWEICILFSANDAYMRELARTVSSPREDGCAPDRMDTAQRTDTTTPSHGLDFEAPDSKRAPG